MFKYLKKSLNASIGGFSLIELGITLVIVGGVATTALIQNTKDNEIKDNQIAVAELSLIKKQVLRYTAENGRLPCPADPAGSNFEEIDRQSETGLCDFESTGVAAIVIGMIIHMDTP